MCIRDRGYTLDVNGIINSSSDIIAYSDQRLKTNFRPLESPVDKIRGLASAVSRFTRIDDPSQREQIGFLAQGVQAVVPEAVQETSQTLGDVENVLSLSDRPIIATLVAALNQALSTIEDLSERLSKLEDQSSHQDNQ